MPDPIQQGRCFNARSNLRLGQLRLLLASGAKVGVRARAGHLDATELRVRSGRGLAEGLYGLEHWVVLPGVKEGTPRVQVCVCQQVARWAVPQTAGCRKRMKDALRLSEA